MLFDLRVSFEWEKYESVGEKNSILSSDGSPARS
jgi:hypothetical protein